MTALPPSSFAREFRAHVVPKLMVACELHGLFVALRIETVREANAEVVAVALDHRAEFLPNEHFSALEDWILDELLAKATAKENEIEIRTARFAHVVADVERWDQDMREAVGAA